MMSLRGRGSLSCAPTPAGHYTAIKACRQNNLLSRLQAANALTVLRVFLLTFYCFTFIVRGREALLTKIGALTGGRGQ